MNARSVSINAVRKPGMTITLILLLFTMLRQAKAADVVVTVTGVLTGGWDQLGIFYTGKEAHNLGGKPFTLVFTFDDAKGKPEVNGNCAAGTGGDGPKNPGTAVLTMGTGSYTFGGGEKFTTSGIYRECSGTSFRMFVTEKKGSYFNEAPMVEMKLIPGNGTRVLPKSNDWRAPMPPTSADNQSSCFIILRQMNSKEVKGCFDAKKVEVTKH